MTADGTGLRERVGGQTNVLFLVPPFAPRGDELCLDLACGGPSPDGAFLSVLGSRTPEDRLRSLKRYVDGPLPSRIGLFSLGDTGRAAGEEAGAVSDEVREVRFDTIQDPGNLTALGVTLSNRLAEWGDTGVTVCFEPLTTLLQYSEVRQVFRFVHVFNQHVGSVDGRSHFHLNPSAHDAVVVNQMKTLFDAVVETDEDGEISVSAR